MTQSSLRALLERRVAFGGLTGGGQKAATQTTVQSNNPPAYAEPYLKDIAAQGASLAQNPLSYFPGSTYAGFSPETELAMTAQTDRAINGNSLMNQSQDYLSNVIGGNYLNVGNPYFADVSKAIMDQVQPAVASQFGGANRVGSGAHESEFARVFANAIAPIALQNYENERSRQQEAAGMAPTYAANDYADLERLAAVGSAREQMTQQGINEAMQRFNFDQMEPWQRLQLQQGSVVPGLMGGTSTSTTTGTNAASNPLLGSLGLGLGILGLFGATGPFGAAGALAL